MCPAPLTGSSGAVMLPRDMGDQTFAAETPLRIAVLDRDSGFLQVLGKRLDRLGWEYRVIGGAVPVDTIVAMRLSAVVVDLAGLGTSAWEWLERLCAELPGLGIVVCTGQSTVAQRVRGLRTGADDWVTKPCHPEEVIARVEAVARRRRRAEPRRDAEATQTGGIEIRPDQFPAFAGGGPTGPTPRGVPPIALASSAPGPRGGRGGGYPRGW